MIKTRINKLREQMERNGVGVYVIQSADFHQSEYTGEYFNTREFMSGFTGSAGSLVITVDKAALFTDGRYFIQAEKQLAGTDIQLMKMGVEGVPTLKEYVDSAVLFNGCVAFDGRTIDAMWGLELEELLEKKSATIHFECDFVDEIWKNRPKISNEAAFILDVRYAGETAKDKLTKVRSEMIKRNVNTHLMATLDDICWLFNIRGNDVKYNPVVLAFAVVTMDSAYLFSQESKFSNEMKGILEKDGVFIKPYEDIYEYIENFESESVLLDKCRINYTLYKKIPASVRIVAADNPTVLMKAVKNHIEVENLKAAHVKDGVAVTKFIYWIKENMRLQAEAEAHAAVQAEVRAVRKAELTELSELTELTASDYLEKCRREQEGFIELSFDTISAYNSNAAMMHYSATAQSNAVLKPEGMLLVDSGGQYFEGTTDITRTIALGPVTDQMKKDFTLTLKGMLALANVKFLYGCTGLNLDILARGPLWEEEIDYRCGTGHGIGYLLNVHESPNGFRWKTISGRNDLCVIEEGMVTSDEPGVYIEGQYGIRIENEIVCKKAAQNEYGQFMKFEMLTLAPIDLSLVDIEYFEKKDIARLNNYHRQVYASLASHLDEKERTWLEYSTRDL